ncbi:MAG: hypothetical protein AAGA03_11765, partial [Planctomycetota bacterium]
MDRRDLLKGAVATSVWTLGSSICQADEARRKSPILGFSKPLANLSPDATAEAVTRVGWDGIECPIRTVGTTHIQPERIEDDLPKMVEALAARGKTVGMVSTSVTEVTPESERLLRAIAANGI